MFRGIVGRREGVEIGSLGGEVEELVVVGKLCLRAPIGMELLP